MDAPFLELRSIGKTYPGVTALQGVSLDVARGEVVGLIGENGAGKSTLMKVLGGVVPPSSGSIVIDGVERPALTVTESMAAGIAFVHQELNLFENLSVAANIFIGREPLTGGPLRLVDTRRLRAMARPLLERLGVEFGPETPVSELSIAQRQMVEIAKALSLDARLIIMDEPTSSLTLTETDRLLAGRGGAAGAGGERHLHHPPPGRDPAVRRPGGLPARRAGGRHAGAGRAHARDDDPADDRARPAARSTSRRRCGRTGAGARSGRCGPPPSRTGR